MQSIPANHHATGVALVVISALVFSSAGIFTKGVTTPAWGVVFWRGIAAAGFTLGYLVLRGQLLREIKAFNMPACAVVGMSAAGTAAFIPAFKLTSVANVALIYGAAPFVAASMAWIFIGEGATGKVILASLAGFAGVLIILSGALGEGNITGDLLALWMTLMMSGVVVIYRRFPQTTAALPAALSSLVLLVPALSFGAPLQAPTAELPVLILFGLVFALASVTLSEGARRLPAAQTALLSTLEMPLAPLLAFWILAETPSVQTLIGGAIILAAVTWSQHKAV